MFNIHTQKINIYSYTTKNQNVEIAVAGTSNWCKGCHGNRALGDA